MNSRFAALFLLLTLTAGPLVAETPGKLSYGGSEMFRFALYEHKIKPLSQAAQAQNSPGDSLIIIVGDVSRIDWMLGGGILPAFLNNGGAILIATDGPAPAVGAVKDWSERFGIQITGNHLTADPKDCYFGRVGEPFVRPRLGIGGGAQSPFWLFDGVEPNGTKAVVTDRPSELSIKEPPDLLAAYLIKYLAGYPPGTRRIEDRQPIDAANTYFAVSLESKIGNKAGRMIVLADHGVLVNGMMGFVRDPAAKNGFDYNNGNWAFAKRTIDWLQAGHPQPRSKCLFIEDGRVIDRFASELQQPPTPPFPDIPPDVIANWLLNSANPMIEEAQEKNFFNRFLEDRLGFPRLVRTFLVLVTLVFLVACVRWLRRGHRKVEPAAVMTPDVLASLVPKGGVLRQRTNSQIEVGNLYDAARRRVRERFDVLGGRPGPSERMPPILTANDLPDGPLLHQSVRWLWVLGYGETPIAIPPADWDRTNVLLERVTARAARGDWSFGQDV